MTQLYPNTVQIETTSACNAHCGFCPHSVMQASGTMPTELIHKLLTEIGAWDRPIQICPFLTNEPFADRRIFDILSDINTLVPKACITIFTNASLLDSARLDKLLAIRNIESIHCSLHHTTEQAYRLELGLDFNRTVANIKRLLAANPTFPTYVLRVSDGNTANDLDFCQFCEREFPAAKFYVAPRWNWKGDIPSTYAPFLDIVCPRHSSICVLHTGKVALCCLDQNADYCLGDTNIDTLLAIYNGAIKARFASVKKREISPCDRCNMR